jgi:hypothetical protein
LLDTPPSARHFEPYYWCYATIATRLCGSATFNRWRPPMIALCLGMQETAGPGTGSWKVERKWDRLYVTSMLTLTLIECAQPPGK